MLPSSVAQAVARHAGGPVQHHEPVGGGCIANACRIEAGGGAYFLKWGAGQVAQTFPAEAAGLRALREANSPLIVPAVVATHEETEEEPGFLLMEWIEPGSKGPDFSEAFGEGLAALHRHMADRYGFERDNFIGRLPQRNTWTESWPAFVRAHRLEPQVQRAREQGRWQQRWNAPLQRLYARLDSLLPERPPASVVHGDLWGGNFLVAASGRAALIDPATYYGHREVDLAMTELFGGFQSRFYEAYRAAWPLASGYATRRKIYNLYHLINHLNHFGGGYAGSVQSILRAFA